MKDILVLKNVALNVGITSMNDVDLLAEGSLAIFDDKNRMLTAANVVANMADSKTVRYVTKHSGAMHWSNVIEREYARVEAEKGKSAVKQVSFIGNDAGVGALNLPGTLIPGTIAFIRIIKEIPIRGVGLEKQRFEYRIKVGDTAGMILTALMNQINNRRDRFVDALIVGVNIGLKLTAREFGVKFSIGLDGVLGNATIEKDGVSNSIALDYGQGTFSQISELEYDLDVTSGKGTKIELESRLFSRNNVANVGTLYDVYAITFDRYTADAISTKLATTELLLVAMPDGATMQTNFEIIQTAIYGLAGGNEETGDDTGV